MTALLYASQKRHVLLVAEAPRTSMKAEAFFFLGLRPERSGGASRSLSEGGEPYLSALPSPSASTSRRNALAAARPRHRHRNTPQEPARSTRKVSGTASQPAGWIPEHHGQSRIFSTMDRGCAASWRRTGVLHAKPEVTVSWGPRELQHPHLARGENCRETWD